MRVVSSELWLKTEVPGGESRPFLVVASPAVTLLATLPPPAAIALSSSKRSVSSWIPPPVVTPTPLLYRSSGSGKWCNSFLFNFWRSSNDSSGNKMSKHFGSTIGRAPSQLITGFFRTLSKKLKDEKSLLKKKNSAKFCPKTQPTAGFSLLKNYKKTPFMKKTGIFAPKTQFFPFKTQCTAGLRPELSCRKVYKKKAWARRYRNLQNQEWESSPFSHHQKDLS